MRECDDQYPWLGEFLCEYVDGTMEPAARAAFEECLRGDPRLAAHVKQLVRARRALCRYGCRVQAPCNLHEALHRRIAGEAILAGRGAPDPASTGAITASADAARLRSLRAAALLVLFCAAASALALTSGEPGDAGASPPALAATEATPVHPAVAARAARTPVHHAGFRAPSRADSFRATLPARAVVPFDVRGAARWHADAEGSGFQTVSAGATRLRAVP